MSRKSKQIKRDILAALSDRKLRSITEISSLTGICRATLRKYLVMMIENLEVEQMYRSERCKLYRIKQKPQFVRCDKCHKKVVVPE